MSNAVPNGGSTDTPTQPTTGTSLRSFLQPNSETSRSHRRKLTRETPCCGRVIGSDWARAQALFSPEAAEHGMFRARSGGPLRSSRADAEQDEHFALSPSCAVAVGLVR